MLSKDGKRRVHWAVLYQLTLKWVSSGISIQFCSKSDNCTTASSPLFCCMDTRTDNLQPNCKKRIDVFRHNYFWNHLKNSYINDETCSNANHQNRSCSQGEVITKNKRHKLWLVRPGFLPWHYVKDYPSIYRGT